MLGGQPDYQVQQTLPKLGSATLRKQAVYVEAHSKTM